MKLVIICDNEVSPVQGCLLVDEQDKSNYTGVAFTGNVTEAELAAEDWLSKMGMDLDDVTLEYHIPGRSR